MARKKPKTISPNEQLLADQAVSLATFAAEALLTADELDIKGKPVEDLQLQKYDREFLAQLPSLSAKFKKKLSDRKSAFTVAEIASLTMMAAESLPDLMPLQQVQLLMIARSLTECLQSNTVARRHEDPFTSDHVSETQILALTVKWKPTHTALQ